MAAEGIKLSDRFPIGPYFDPERSSTDEYIERLYELFLSDLISRPLRWMNTGMTVSLRRHPEVEGRHAVFWHIVTGGTGNEATRRIELQRCVRLRWVRILIEIFNSEFPNEEQIRWWVDKSRSSKPRYVITRPDFDYVVVVEERIEYALLITAYYVEHQRRRRTLKREHDEYWEQQEPPT